jgi:hypothetical protein
MVELEWSACRWEAEGGLVAAREGRQLRVELMRTLAAFEKSLIAPARKLTPQEILAEIRGDAA